MKKIFVLACGVVLFATSCLTGGGSAGTSSANYSGYLTVSEIESGKTTYTDDKAVVTVRIPNIIEPKFDVIFNNIKFATMMPKLNIEFEGLPFVATVSEDESTLNHIFNVKDVVPTIGGVPYDKYKVDSIKGCIGRPVTIEFWMSSKDNMVHFTTAKEENN
ncbi:MAG: hypothetical protein IKB90_07220 [Alistipes sp.]|nr:hypothetical protein [Alistipes sp.]